MSTRRHRLSILLFLLFFTPAYGQQSWPGFLGAGRSSDELQDIPLKWTPSENIAWTTSIPGYGQSSPVIWEERVYVTSVEGTDKETLHVVCYDLVSGKVLWDKKLPSSYPETNSVYISRAAPTPVVDEEGICAYFESGDVVALSHSGELRWTTSLNEQHGAPTNRFGLSASPVQWQDRLIILVDDEGSSYLTALDKTDGKEVWTAERTSRRSWSSPMLIPCSDSMQVVCSSGGSIDGYDPATGKQLWSFTEVGGNSNTSPTIVSEGAVLIAASPGRDGENSELAKKSNGLFVIDREEGDWKPRFEWTSSKPTPSWGSPVAYKGFAYWVNRAGVVFCLDIDSGDIAYTQRTKQSCWATPVGIGDHVYLFGKEGLTTVLATGRDFQIVAENSLWSEEAPPQNNIPAGDESSEERRRSAGMFSRPTVYGVALVDNHLIARTGSQIFCIRNLENGQ